MKLHSKLMAFSFLFEYMWLIQKKNNNNRPLDLTKRAFINAIRSSIFLGAFVSWYQLVCCGHRRLIDFNLIQKDNKLTYWFAGIISSLSILIEHKARRSELAMYVLPKGVDSLYKLMRQRKWIIHIPHFEVMMVIKHLFFPPLSSLFWFANIVILIIIGNKREKRPQLNSYLSIFFLCFYFAIFFLALNSMLLMIIIIIQLKRQKFSVAMGVIIVRETKIEIYFELNYISDSAVLSFLFLPFPFNLL